MWDCNSELKKEQFIFHIFEFISRNSDFFLRIMRNKVRTGRDKLRKVRIVRWKVAITIFHFFILLKLASYFDLAQHFQKHWLFSGQECMFFLHASCLFSSFQFSWIPDFGVYHLFAWCWMTWISVHLCVVKHFTELCKSCNFPLIPESVHSDRCSLYVLKC